LKWIFHRFDGMTDEELASQPLGIESCPFGMVQAPGLPVLPVTRTSPGTYGVVPRTERPRGSEIPSLRAEDLAVPAS